MSVWVVFYFVCKDNPPNCESMEHGFKFTILSHPCVTKALREVYAIVVVGTQAELWAKVGDGMRG